MNIVHAVDYDSSNFLETLVRTHCRDSVSLYQYVAFGEKLDCLESVLLDEFVEEKRTLRVLPLGPTIR
jgi:hypothetical protein